MFKKNKKYLTILAPIILIVSFSLAFYFVSPEELIGFIGIENAYIFIFILAFLGGLSTFISVPYHVVLVALATGGVNPILLGLVTAVGVILGDSTSYYVGYKGGELLTGRLNYLLNKFSSIRKNHPKLLTLIFFVYGSFVPFSNDVIVIPMGLLRYPFWKVIIPLGIGNVIFNTGLALIAVNSYEFLMTLPFFG